MNSLSVQPTLTLRGKSASEMRFEDFMTLEFDEKLNEDFNKNRKYADVGIVNGAIDSKSARFYLKRTYHESLEKMFKQAAAMRIPHFNTMREAISVAVLKERGFLVNDVVASGERTMFGIPRCSFVILGEVEGVLLHDCFTGMTGKDRSVAMQEYGDLLAHLHDSGFFHRLKFCDLMYRKTGAASCDLVLIDRDVTSPYPVKGELRKPALQNTATNLRFNFKKFPLSAREGLSFLRGYKGRSKLFSGDSKREWYRIMKAELLELLRQRPIWQKHGTHLRVPPSSR